jgi:glycosyltransferase 2 family protein
MSSAVIFKALKVILPLFLGAYLMWYFFSSMDENATEAFKSSLRHAHWGIILFTALLGAIAYFLRAWRWKYQLEPMGYKTNFSSRYHSLMMGYIINLTIPRAGEASRAFMLQRFHPVPFSAGFGTIITERIIDVLLLLGFISVTILLLSNDFQFIYSSIQEEFGQEKQGSYFFWVILIILVFGLLFIVRKSTFRTKILTFIQTLSGGIFSVFKMPSPWKYITFTILMWSNYFLMFQLAFYAFELTQKVPIEGVLCAFIAGGLSISITNGGIGTYPLVVGWVIQFFLQKEGISNGKVEADALGMLIWSSQTVVLLLMGLISFFFIPSKSKANDTP